MNILYLLTCCVCFSTWAFCNYLFSVKIPSEGSSINAYFFAAIVPMVASLTVFSVLGIKLANNGTPLSTVLNVSDLLQQTLIIVVAGLALGASYLLYFNLIQSSQSNSVLVLIGNFIVVFMVFKFIAITPSGSLFIENNWNFSLREVIGLLLCLLGVFVLKLDVFMTSISFDK
jgi:uncharacterized membrane protein